MIKGHPYYIPFIDLCTGLCYHKFFGFFYQIYLVEKKTRMHIGLVRKQTIVEKNRFNVRDSFETQE